MTTMQDNVVPMPANGKTHTSRYPVGTTAAELMAKTFAPLRWTVPGYCRKG